MPLSRERTFDLWANPASPWSVWCKPIIFSHLPPTITPTGDMPSPSPVATPWAPPADGTTVLVIDLPGVASVCIGEALVYAGFRPVLLFNAVPGPYAAAESDLGRSDLPRTVVDVYPSIEAVGQASLRLRDLLGHLPAPAPPAFLLDADRRLGNEPRPGDFDNRSVSLPTDFPSAAFLQSRGVTRAVVARESYSRTADAGQPATDLAHTLLRWQAAGISILLCTLDESLEGSMPEPINVERPSWFGTIWHNALSVVGLQRNLLGGFGGKLSVPSAG